MSTQLFFNSFTEAQSATQPPPQRGMKRTCIPPAARNMKSWYSDKHMPTYYSSTNLHMLTASDSGTITYSSGETIVCEK